MKWKKLSSKQIFDHPRIKIYEDEVELPNGLKTSYMHYGEGLAASMVIAINNEGKILLQKEYSYPPNEILYQLPGGLLDPDEPPEIGANRELAEEAGFTGTLEPIGWFYVDNRRSAKKMHIFVARDLKPAQAEHDPEEAFEDHWVTETEFDSLIAEGKIQTYTALAGWALYKARSKT